MDSPPSKLPQWMIEKNKVDTVVDKKQKKTIHRSVLEDSLPFLEFQGSIVYSYNSNDSSLLSEDIISTLPDGAVLGFDIEWTPCYSKGKEKKVALIQLCESEKKCYLFHISSVSGFPLGLKRLLEDDSIKKAGVGIEGDKWKLMRDFEVKLERLVDLADLANKKLKCEEIWSLNNLVKHLFHKQLLKDDLVRCGNWEEFPLTKEQKLYAATDAYAGFLIYQKLMELSSDEWIQNVEKDSVLGPNEIKKKMVSLAEEMLDVTKCLPGRFEKSTNVQRAAEILASMSQDFKVLRRALLVESTELNCVADPGTINANQEQTENSDLSFRVMWNDHVNYKAVDVQNETLTESQACLAEKNQVDGGSNSKPQKSLEHECIMSLDITEYELQMLERQAEEVLIDEAACMSEKLNVKDKEDSSCTIESDVELELEMLNSLEDVSKVADFSFDKSLRQNELIADDEDEGVEEEEEEFWDSCLPRPSDKEISCLKMYFGHSSFKPVQWKVISSVLQDRRDNLVVMATGYGKSLCFQFPPVYTRGTGIVISPLISLMEDQVLQLEMSGVRACLLGSAQSKNIRGQIRAGHYRVVYVTPEFCSGNLLWLQDLNQTIGITLIAVDEAHCISEWGHDFRSSFRSLKLLKKTLPEVPIVALTATASPSIRNDIIDCLNLKNPQVTCTSFDRPNLYLEVRRKRGNVIQDLQPFLIKKEQCAYEFEGPTIVYCPSRKTTEQVAAELKKIEVLCGTYHAGMGIKARQEIHHKFMRDEVQCIVATVAFGMGINKPDIRMVIHYGAPKEMESYYQEIGRAGRDGLPASCYVLWTPADMSLNRHLLNEIHNEGFRLYKLKMMAKIEKYLNLNGCRRKIILSHFEDKQLRKASSGIMGTEKCCDNCRSRSVHTTTVLNPEDSLQDFGPQAYQLMSAICALNERFGIGAPVLFLRGSFSQRLPDKFRTHALFGSGKDWPENSWKALGRQLITEGFLKEVSGQSKFSTMCVLTQKGKDWFCQAKKGSGRKLLLHPYEELCPKKATVSCNTVLPKPEAETQKTSLHDMYSYQKASKASKGSISSNQRAAVPLPLLSLPLSPTGSDVSPREKELQALLYGKLVAARQKLASEKDVPPAVLATNKVLVDMTMTRPTTVENLKKIDGVSEGKSTMLAPLMITIKEFCQANNLEMDVFKNSGFKEQPEIVLQKDGGCSTLTESEHITYVMFQKKNMSLKCISDSRSLPLAVIGTHLSQALRAGYPVDLQRVGLTSEIKDTITKVIQNPPINSDFTHIKAIRALVPANIELYLIRITIALLEKEHNRQQLGHHTAPEKQKQTQEPGNWQSNTKASQKNEGIQWIKAKEDLINAAAQKLNVGTSQTIKQSTSCGASSSWTKSSYEEEFSGTKQDDQSSPSALELASWNQPLFNAEEEELFTDSQSQPLCQSSKRKLPEWFGATGGAVPHVSISKKSKGGGSKGLFG